jgi:hypothetical protein
MASNMQHPNQYPNTIYDPNGHYTQEQGYGNQAQPSYPQQYPVQYTQSPTQTTIVATSPSAVTVQNEDMSDTDNARLFFILGFFLHILWPINFFMTRQKCDEARRYGNISCIIFSILTILAVIIAVIVIIIIVVIEVVAASRTIP